jgi:8-oxo-dGTP diphosphatase
MNIRTSAKAIIINDGKLLTIKLNDNGDYFYILPGGGQHHGENLYEALRRECLEEVGGHVEIGELVFVREYIGKNHELAKYHSHAHQNEFMFRCELVQPLKEGIKGSNPDKGQIGVEWLPIDELRSYNFYPKDLRETIIKYHSGEQVPTYVGDIN